MRRLKIGSTAQAAAIRANRSVLLISQGTSIEPPVLVIHDGSPDADGALPLACHLGRTVGGFLTVLVRPVPSRSSSQVRQEVAQRWKGAKLAIRYRGLADTGVTSLIEGIRVERAGILVVRRAVLHPVDIQRLLDELDCPALLVH